VFTKLAHSTVAHSSLRIETFQAIYLLSQRGLLKLEDRDFPSYDFPSYLSSLSERLSTWIDSLYGGSLKLEDRDFPSYLSSLSERLSTWIDSPYGGSLKLEDIDFPTYLSSLSKKLTQA